MVEGIKGNREIGVIVQVFCMLPAIAHVDSERYLSLVGTVVPVS